MDDLLVQQVLMNLLENAAQYTPAGHADRDLGPLATASRSRSRWPTAGPAFRKAISSRLFEKFYRGRRNRGAAGAGSGLAICRGIVELHGGKIRPRRSRRTAARVPLFLALGRRASE